MYIVRNTLLSLDQLQFHADAAQLYLSCTHVKVNSSLLDQQSRRDERDQYGIL